MINLDVTDKAFLDEVACYVRGESSDKMVSYMESEENIYDLLQGLIVLKSNVESQLASYKSRSAKRRFEIILEEDDFDFAWSEYLADNADWRAKAIKFINSIECYIKHVKSLISSYRNQDTSSDLTDDDLIGMLISGIIDSEKSLDQDPEVSYEDLISEVAKRMKKTA